MTDRTGAIDVQHHILPPAYVDAVGAEAIGSLLVSGKVPVWTPQISVEAMDRNGIALAVTSISAPAFPSETPQEARRLARLCNDYAARACADHPGRFGMFASLPMPDIAASLRELEYALDELGADGVCLMTSYDGRYPGHADFRELFQELEHRGTVVHMHPVATPGPQYLPGIPAATLDFPFDTTRAVLSLLFEGVLSRLSRSRIILSHAGGALPFLADRIARLERRPDFRAAVPEGARNLMQRLYVDTALSANRSVFPSLLELFPPEQILFASDYPFAPEDTMTATVTGLDALALPDDALAAIRRENALRLMPTLAARM
ncbi:amidohydrolase family protein [Sinisalibacter aestuarii]|uniref:Amidohydrolase-related domain-containing protein n=1 Tax=Sinisalibacter aestuarii TaxID=2949426 RepID=A0ABQ5M0A5_9RHOB|nr:amidohydrolase family protein [Sinisalibacter aestuarii]GKY89932.1 hypothetical protein STA1M1_38010 [Sinisalibacter aestuarii]